MRKASLGVTFASILIGAVCAFGMTQSLAASPKASPQVTKSHATKAPATKAPATKTVPTAKTSSKPVAPKKVTATKTSIAKKTVVPKKTTTAKKSVTVRKAVPRKIVRRATVKRQITPLASPSPKWPPQGFKFSDGIYAKVPSGSELVSIISAQKNLALAIQQCEKSACGAVLVASTAGCVWWEIDSSIFGPSSADPTKLVEYGTLRTTANGTKPKVVSTVLLVSTEPLAPSVSVRNIAAKCWSSPPPEKVPNNTYIPNTVR